MLRLKNAYGVNSVLKNNTRYAWLPVKAVGEGGGGLACHPMNTRVNALGK